MYLPLLFLISFPIFSYIFSFPRKHIDRKILPKGIFSFGYSIQTMKRAAEETDSLDFKEELFKCIFYKKIGYWCLFLFIVSMFTVPLLR